MSATRSLRLGWNPIKDWSELNSLKDHSKPPPPKTQFFYRLHVYGKTPMVNGKGKSKILLLPLLFNVHALFLYQNINIFY